MRVLLVEDERRLAELVKSGLAGEGFAVDIALTPKEFAVLHSLARRPGEVVSKAELLEQAWDFAYAGDPSIVEVYISALHRKIDAPFGRSSLVTVRGAGYRLDGLL
ncbi:DNA-binding response OmpR family regulator [Streptosporangium album]|uniref:DNA-binding response OmpR family regulator n=1 Tax=Streptosporangium album TaxID=47479 RepID=A0A7W7S5M9_9ACTN|nr:DNA-binding response regulator [Streptosporangium album]MBB4944147.1 DNA-binding response OmpR family regulator [Streptosporangium album]